MHLFALIKPVVAYGCDSLIAERTFHSKNSQACQLSSSRYWRSKHWSEASEVVPVRSPLSPSPLREAERGGEVFPCTAICFDANRTKRDAGGR